MKEYRLNTGAKLKISLAPFKESRELFKSFAKHLKVIDLSGVKNAQSEIDANMIKDIVLTVLSEDEIEQKIMDCSKWSTYNDFKITEQLLDDEESIREDYLEMMTFIAYENCLPFMKGLLPKLKELLPEVLKSSLT